MAWAVAETIQELQVLPLLMNLVAVSQALDVLGIPAAVRTAAQPDIIDQMSQRLPYLLDRAFSANEDAILHELLDEAALSRSDALGRTSTLPERLKSGVDELLIWRGLAAERAAAATATADTLPTELIVMDATRQLAIDELTMALADQMVPTMVFDSVMTTRVEQILTRLVVVSADQGKLRQEVSQLHRLVTNRMGKDKQLRLQIEQGFTRIENKICLIERSANTANQLSERQHTVSRQQIASLEQQIVSLKQQIVALTRAVSEPRVDTAEVLLREALDGSEVAEILQQINQRAATPDAESVVVRPVVPAAKARTDYTDSPEYLLALSLLAASIKESDTTARLVTLERGIMPVVRPVAATPAPVSRNVAIGPAIPPVTVPQLPVSPRQLPVRPEAIRKRLSIGFKASLVFLVAVILALVAFGTIPLATTASYPVTNPIAQLQERMGESGLVGPVAHNSITQAYRDAGEAFLKNSARNAVNVFWASAQSTSVSAPLWGSIVNLKSGQTYLMADDKINPQYPFIRDATTVKQWQNLLGLIVTEKSRNSDIDAALSGHTAKTVENWLRGYQPPSEREGSQKPLYMVPTPDQVYASMYSPLLEQVPWQKARCIIPSTAAGIVAVLIPPGVLRPHLCPVMHLTPAIFTTFGNLHPGERQLALKHPADYWNHYCVLSSQIQPIHDYANIPIAELKAKSCN